MIDKTLAAATDDNGDDVDIVKWYSHLLKKYPTVHKMAMSILSIFHGLKVESSFSAMGDVINKKANTKKQVKEENNNNVKESRAKYLTMCTKVKKGKSKESVNDDK